MSFLHEHTWAGEAGYLLVIIAFVTTLSVVTSCVLALRNNRTTAWVQFSRFLLVLHSVALFSAIGLLFWMITNHYFEYHYVWKYSNLAMEAKYILSCFWSGQEGSFMLWSFWIAVLAWFVVAQGGKWEAPVLLFAMAIQAFLISMLLGVYIGDVRIGSSPFILIRQLPENASLPWASMQNYLERITSFQDGVGLNPLLQNYWMVIHPPILFLGFAATVFPFAFSLAAVVTKDRTGWKRPALTWSVFAVMVLGTGILLGGAWAYESLSFGGFWAWDPVENASLVPWLLAVTGLHFLHIAEKRRRGVFPALLFSAAPFVFVVYSSFLTRSGILGESSVHSFTENGLFIQLLIFLLAVCGGTIILMVDGVRARILYLILSALCFVIYLISDSLLYSIGPWILGSVVILLYAYEHYYTDTGPDADAITKTSREFWMFTAGLIIIMSAVQITLSTSIPVINILFGTKLDAFTELASRNVFYHTWQIPLAIMVCLLIGIGQFLQYRKTDLRALWRKIGAAVIASVIVSLIAVVALRYDLRREWHYIALMVSAVFAFVMNLDFGRRLLRQNIKNAGSSLAHAGFSLLLIGALVSGSRKDVISRNVDGFDLKELNNSFKNDENILLRHGDTLLMNKFFVNYRGRSLEHGRLHYEITYYRPRLSARSNRVEPGDSAFTLYPQVQLNEQFGNVSEPGTKHFLTSDVFTHIKYADMQAGKKAEPNDGYMSESTLRMKLGSEATMENFSFRFRQIKLIDEPAEKIRAGFRADDLVVSVELGASNLNEENPREFTVEPMFVVRDSVTIIPHHVYSKELDARLRIVEIPQEPNSIVVGIRQREFVVMQAYIFPGMNLLWSGCVLMVLGCFVGWRRRIALSGRDSEKM
jgi:cytochrome c-type biogenesis protein CcmF